MGRLPQPILAEVHCGLLGSTNWPSSQQPRETGVIESCFASSQLDGAVVAIRHFPRSGRHGMALRPCTSSAWVMLPT